MKRMLQILAIISVFLGLMLFNGYASNLSESVHENFTNYFIQQALMVLWLAISGFLIELPRIVDVITQPGLRLRVDLFVLILYGLPALFLALLPLVVSSFGIVPPSWLINPSALPAEVIGGFLFGIAVGKSITKEEYRVF